MTVDLTKGMYYGDDMCGVFYADNGEVYHYFMGQLEQPRKESEEE
ncbi:hypothetical protein ACFYU8_31175 [Brevibacillus sp. NPDC003359]